MVGWGQKDQELEKHWRGVIEQWLKSGQSQAEFCRQHRLKYNTFNGWLQTIRKRDAESNPKIRPRKKRTLQPVFVPVESHDRHETLTEWSAPIAEIRLDHGVISVFASAGMDTWRALLAALKENSC